MPDNILKGIITLDGSSFTKSVSQLTEQLKRFEKELTNVKSVESFNRINRAIDATKQKLAALNNFRGDQVFSKVTVGANQASFAMTNLGRIVQDAPFGFIGISNNLNPMLESFQRLKATTGSTGSALKALGSSLIGPGGIGFAVSAVSSLLVVFGSRLFGGSKAAKEAAEENEKLAKSITGDLTKLTVLVGIIQNVNTSNEERVKALKLINEQYGKYIPNLEKEGITAQNIAASYDKITDALLRQAVTKGLQDEIEKAVSKTAEAIIKLQIEQERQRISGEKTEETTVKQIDAYGDVTKALNRYNNTVRDGYLVNAQSDAQLTKRVQKTKDYDALIGDLKTKLKEGLSPLLNLSTSLVDLDVKDLVLNPKNVEVKEDKLKVLKFPGRVSEADVIAPDEGQEPGLKFGEMFYKELQSYFNSAEPIDFSLLFALRDEKDKKLTNIGLFKNLDEEQVKLFQLGQTISNTITPAFDAMVSAIAKGENAFRAFGEGVKQILIQVIQKLVQTAILAAVLSALFPDGVGTNGPKGFGAIFGSLLGFGGARAGGGPVSGGQSYLVGERGPEIFTPGVSGAIIPNRAGRIGPMGGGGVYEFIIRGNNLVGVLANANRSQSRLS